MKLIKKIISVLTSIFIAFFSSCLFAYNLPSLGSTDNPYFTKTQIHQMGQQFMRYVRAYLPIDHDPIANTYLQNLGYDLVAHCPNPSIRFHFFIVNDSDINAFSGPDGYVGVNSGLILRAHNESELAAVLSHEIAHVTQQHLLRSMAKQKDMSLVSIASIAAAIALGMYNPQAAMGVLTAGTAGTYQHYLNYSRQFEKEADSIGIKILAASGFNPNSMAIFFQRLANEERYNDSNLPELLLSHPVTESRIAEAENLSATLSRKKHYKNSIELQFAQGRLLIDQSQNIPALIRHLQTDLKHKPSVTLQYAYALALSETKNDQKALVQMKPLMKKYPDALILKVTYAEILSHTSQIKNAKNTYKNLYKNYPDYYPLMLDYAYFLKTQGQYNPAIEMLNDHYDSYDHDISFLSLLSKIQGDAKQYADAYQNRAKIFLLVGNKSAAVQQLTMALQYTKNNSFLKEQINAKLKAIKDEQKPL